MGDNVKVSIGSSFDSTGVRQAKLGMQQVSDAARANNAVAASAGAAGRAMRGGASGAAALSAALGAGTGGVAATARGASAAMAGFSSGGWWGLIIALVAAGAAAWISYRARIKQAMEESTAAFKKHVSEILSGRLDRITDNYKRQAEAIREAARASAELTAASAKADNAQAKLFTATLEGEKNTRLSVEKDPAARKRIELEFAQKIAAVELNAAKLSAQYAEQTARGRLAAAEKARQNAGGEIATLQNELGQTQEKLKPEIMKRLQAAREKEASASVDARAAQMELTAAMDDVAAATVRMQLSETLFSQQMDELNRSLEARKASAQEIEANESEIASKSADLANAIDDEAKAHAAAARAKDRADKLDGGTLKGFVENRRAAAEQAEEERKEDDKFKRRVAYLKDKRESGKRLSRGDQLTLDFAEQRGRAVEANLAAADRQMRQAQYAAQTVTYLQDTVNELRTLNNRLAQSLEVQ